MRRLLLVVLVLVSAAPADAHVLTLPGARRVAGRDARALARLSARTPPKGDVTYRLGTCTRRSNHVVDCKVDFLLRGFDPDRVCKGVIRVSFPSARSRSTRTSYPGKAVCSEA